MIWLSTCLQRVRIFPTTTHVSPSNYDNPMSHVVLRVIKGGHQLRLREELPVDVKQFSNFRKKHEVAATILGVTADKSQVDI